MGSKTINCYRYLPSNTEMYLEFVARSHKTRQRILHRRQKTELKWSATFTMEVILFANHLQSRHRGRLEKNRWGYAFSISFKPADSTQAPLVAGLQAGKVRWMRAAQVIAALSSELQKFCSHLNNKIQYPSVEI